MSRRGKGRRGRALGGRKANGVYVPSKAGADAQVVKIGDTDYVDTGKGLRKLAPHIPEEHPGHAVGALKMPTDKSTGATP